MGPGQLGCREQRAAVGGDCNRGCGQATQALLAVARPPASLSIWEMLWGLELRGQGSRRHGEGHSRPPMGREQGDWSGSFRGGGGEWTRGGQLLVHSEGRGRICRWAAEAEVVAVRTVLLLVVTMTCTQGLLSFRPLWVTGWGLNLTYSPGMTGQESVRR